ncbi:MAG: Flp pilus assembly complex ATPase component [Planctomycetes bacterium]|nr:Flp pilus assembly complex ATPase component [Planctomycetota bacterium]
MAKFDSRLKKILVTRGVITDEQGEQYLGEAENQDKSFSEVLMAQGVSERDIIGSISSEMNIPPLDISKVQITGEVLDSLPEELANNYGVMPIARIGKILTVAVANPFDILKLDDIQLVTHCELRPVLSTDVSIRDAITRCYHAEEEAVAELLETEEADGIEEVEQELDEGILDITSLQSGGDSPVIKLVNLLIVKALKAKAADIHIEPFEKHTRVRFRVDGVLHEEMCPPKRLHNSVVSRIKIMGGMDIAERKLPQDGKFQLKVEGRQVDFRVSILPVVHGEKAVMRILDKSNLALQLEDLGWEPGTLASFREAITSPWGMIMCVGPTGCGKTTTLYSGLQEVTSPEDNLITVEDPVEYELDGINQVQVNPKRGRTFAAVLRSILRQDPDTVMVGEIRDLETAEISIQAALTGHLVLSTLHTNDAPSTITRMVDMGIDPFMVAASVILVVGQRLCRKLCDNCKQAEEYPKDVLQRIGFLPEELEDAHLFKTREEGCNLCTAGYKGRFAVVESLPLTEDIKRLILDGASAIDLKNAALEGGEFLTMRRTAIINSLRGKTSLEEVERVTMED